LNFVDLFGKNENNALSCEAQIWNQFVTIATMNEESSFTALQKFAVLPFWYDNEVNSGGHSGYFDCCFDIKPNELLDALNEIGAHVFADNFQRALLYGKEDDYAETDRVFGNYNPSLSQIIQQYVILHAEKLGLSLD
jgi:hypothetical protein